MAEFEFKEFYVQTTTGKKKTFEQDRKLHIERLYLDYDINENYSLRVGKYNSPIGYWNLLLVNVLRETTSNPVSSYIVYPEFTAGLAGSYSSYNDSDFKIDVMVQHNGNIDAEYNNYAVDEHYGVGISYGKNNFSVKINVGVFENLRKNGTPQELYYGLLSTQYDANDFQIIAEVGSQKSDNEFTTEYAGFVQGLYRFNEKHIAVLRLESYSNKVNNLSENTAIVGYAYRPTYPIALKSEYQFHSVSKNQFLFSLSVLF